MKRLNFSVLLMLALAGFAASAQAGDNGGEGWSVRWQNRRLSVQANNIALATVVQAIAGQTSMKIVGMDKLKGNAQADFADLSLNEGLAALLQGANYRLTEQVNRQGAYLLSIFSDSPAASRQPVFSAAKPFKIPASAGYVAQPYRQLYALAAQGDVKSLRAAALTGDSAAQSIAIKLLAQRSPAEAVRVASASARSDDSVKRLSAVQSLAELDDKTALTALKAALADSDPSVRQAAVLGLHNQTAPAVIPLLTAAMMGDTSDGIRRLALDLLAERGSDALGGLRQALGSEDPSLRERARELLDQMAPE